MREEKLTKEFVKSQFDKLNFESKLICEFMGYEKEPEDEEYHIKSDFVRENYCSLKSMQFSSSYDWLMPVVEKIEKMGVEYKVTITEYKDGIPLLFNAIFKTHDNESWKSEVIVQSGSHTEYDNNYRLKATYVAVIEFINFYNKFTKNEN